MAIFLNKVFLMKKLRDLTQQYSLMDKQEQAKHTQWKVFICTILILILV